MSDNTNVEKQKKQKTPYKKSAMRAKIAGILCLVLVAVVLFFMSPIFGVDEILVEGNINITPEEIIVASGVKKGDNIFSVNASDVEAGLSKFGKIASVVVTRSFPSSVTIRVDERVECAYIKEKATYTQIDENGRVLATASGIESAVPVIQGIKIVDSEVGQFMKIDAGNAAELSSLITRMLSELKVSGIVSNVKTIDLSDLSNIRMILQGDTLVNMGEDGEEDGNNIEYKIAYLRAIIPELPASQNGGVIELADTENVTSRMS